jgi:hypothetical protein
VKNLVPPVALGNPSDPFWINTKMSDDFLDRLFDMFYGRLHLPNLMRKNDYYRLAAFVPVELIDPDVVEKLDEILKVADQATTPHEA